MQLLRINASTNSSETQQRQYELRWDHYVSDKARCVADTFAWQRVVSNSYDVQADFLAVTEDGSDEFVAVLALYEIKHALFGHYLTTAPFGNDGGIFFNNDQARDVLLDGAKKLADELVVDYLLIRTRNQRFEGFNVDSHYRCAELSLDPDVEQVWMKQVKSKARNQVRRGQKEGFEVLSGHDQMMAFYEVFHTHMRDLGSPAHKPEYYKNIIDEYGDRAQFIVLKDGDELAAGALMFEINGVAMNPHTVALKHFNRRCPNYLIYWHMIKSACESGQQTFDMGRSEADGPHIKFKQNWGTELVTLDYNYYLSGLKAIPYLDPRNPKYKLAIEIWKRLPLAVTKRIGPMMIRGIV